MPFLRTPSCDIEIFPWYNRLFALLAPLPGAVLFADGADWRIIALPSNAEDDLQEEKTHAPKARRL